MNFHPFSFRNGLRAVALLGTLATTAASAGDSAHENAGVHWGYTDLAGPSHWNSLAGSGLCSTGRRQSPIALDTSSSTPQEVPVPVFSYGDSRVDMINNGHTVQFAYDEGSAVSIDGVRYRLAQLHFHTPSEHTIDGVSYPLEVHLVHTDAKGKPAVVVGVLVKAGPHPHPELEPAFQHFPTHPDEHITLPGAIVQAGKLLPDERTFFHYSGSLTTPPCTEGIQWYVMRNPIELPPGQIDAYRVLAYLNPSNRPLQARNARTVTLTKVGGAGASAH